MAEDKDLKQRVLERAREQHVEEDVVRCILNLVQDEKQKLPDLLKAFDFLQGLEKEDTSTDALPDTLDTEDMSGYTDAELRDLQARLEEYLKGESDGEPTKELPDRRPPSDAAPSISPPSPSGTPEQANGGTPGINLDLGTYLHG